MIKKLILATGCFIALLSTTANAVYFPGGIDWTNPSQNRFVLSLYLNALGRPPEASEMSKATRFLTRGDTSQTRLDLFKNMLGNREYQQLFGKQDNQWRVYQAPDYNYGDGFRRYQAANTKPPRFELLQLSGSSSESVAQTMAHYYDAFCYQGTPCISNPVSAYKRGAHTLNANAAHACADETKQISQFQWVGINGTTYPRGTDTNTLCMGQHYYQATGSVLERYQCESGYVNCRRDPTRDIQGQRTGQDNKGNPALFFSDGSRLVLTNYNDVIRYTQSGSGIKDEPLLVDNTGFRQTQHDCANPARATTRYRWSGPNGITESVGIDQTIICMDNGYYQIEGVNLKRFDCGQAYTNCKANTARDIRAERRKRVDGYPGLEFRNGTTLALIKKGNSAVDATASPITTSPAQQGTTGQQRTNGQHECADPRLRTSQFRWMKQNGTSNWPDGVGSRQVCLNNAYYEIDEFTLRHYQCSDNFTNCRANRSKNLIAVNDSTDTRGYRTLIFANGDQLSLISQ